MKLLTRQRKLTRADIVKLPNPQLVRERKDDCLATWWHQSTPGTTYWRCLVPARHLPGQSLPVTEQDVKIKGENVVFPRMRGETAIWQFLGDQARSRLALAMREALGTRLLIEVDDNYTRAAPYMKNRAWSPWKETIAEAGAGYSNETHRLLLPHADGVICATDYLANIYSEFNDNIFVCPNSIDPDDWQYEREPHDTFRIIYYGSSSHLRDAPLVTRALKWASKQPGVEVYTAGFKNPAWSFSHQTIPWKDHLEEARKELFRFDLGIAPLKGDPWARGKSDVKILEYAMAGVLPLMSHEEPFRFWFDRTPDLVVSDGGWEERIRWAVGNQDDVRVMGGMVRDFVLEHRTIHNSIGAWREAISR